MNYNKAVFEFAAGRNDQLPESTLPEIVFSGKSNVGKSSLINKLLNRKALARVSATPGKTATINSYLVEECRFIDLPGYGFAKVSQQEKKRWAELVEGYFAQNRNIKLIIQLLDIRHEPSAEDYDMINFLIDQNYPFVAVCTKKDKLNKTELEKNCTMFSNLFDEHEIHFIPFSATKGDGCDEIKAIIENAVSE